MPLAAAGIVYWVLARSGSRQIPVADGPQDEPYRVYTRDHDLSLRARDVPSALTADGSDRAGGWVSRDPAVWREKVDSADRILSGISPDHAPILRNAFSSVTADEWAICLLIDHSGSMRGDPILHAAATSRWISGQLGELGATSAILGFSTVGWRGGRARKDWLAGGQPKRPGRLCALLHILYKPFDEPFADEDWAIMLHPDVLRENVDGEAIIWACGMLRDRPEPNRLLVVLSEGAPVDDSTLTQNGGKILWRHVKSVIAEVEAVDDIILAAIGINYRVDEFYKRSRSVEDLTELPAALSTLIADIVRQPAGTE
ncbi:MAG: cobalamin biosynthesis protein CobT [Pseudomonadota bacterium]